MPSWGLSGAAEATAGDVDVNVETVAHAKLLKGLFHNHFQRFALQVFLHLHLVDDAFACSGCDPDTGHGVFPSANCIISLHTHFSLRLSSTGF